MGELSMTDTASCVTDDMVAKAVSVYWNEPLPDVGANPCMHAALVAVHPMIEAQVREECASGMSLSEDTIRLFCGEMTASEMRAVKAVLKWQAAVIKRG
jgi:hypothetical protein